MAGRCHNSEVSGLNSFGNAAVKKLLGYLRENYFHMISGGYGMCSRSFGLLSDYVVGFKIILANGNHLAIMRPDSHYTISRKTDKTKIARIFWNSYQLSPYRKLCHFQPLQYIQRMPKKPTFYLFCLTPVQKRIVFDKNKLSGPVTINFQIFIIFI